MMLQASDVQTHSDRRAQRCSVGRLVFVAEQFAINLQAVSYCRLRNPTIEAVEDPYHRFAAGVLWHPEASEDCALFEGLVDEARRYAEARR